MRVEGVDTHALLDSGSAVEGERFPVTCVHSDVQQYPTTSLYVQTPNARYFILFERYWSQPGELSPP